MDDFKSVGQLLEFELNNIFYQTFWTFHSIVFVIHNKNPIGAVWKSKVAQKIQIKNRMIKKKNLPGTYWMVFEIDPSSLKRDSMH